MTQAQDNDDAAWLATLAGQENTAADASTRAQAEALRTALQAQSQRMDSRVPLADDAQYQQLLFRLRGERLAGNASPLTHVMEWGRARGQMAARAMASHNTLAWGLAAFAVLVVGVALQLNRVPQGSDGPDMRLILRGQGTVLIVQDTQARAAELVAGLKAAGVEPTLQSDKLGSFQLKFLATDAALDYLNTQRIEAQPVDGWVTLTLMQPQKKSDGPSPTK
jgi:hypothetical protein